MLETLISTSVCYSVCCPSPESCWGTRACLIRASTSGGEAAPDRHQVHLDDGGAYPCGDPSRTVQCPAACALALQACTDAVNVHPLSVTGLLCGSTSNALDHAAHQTDPLGLAAPRLLRAELRTPRQRDVASRRRARQSCLPPPALCRVAVPRSDRTLLAPSLPRRQHPGLALQQSAHAEVLCACGGVCFLPLARNTC
jgi:hypothetical protein